MRCSWAAKAKSKASCGVGGFLRIGQEAVAIPLDQVQWMSNQEVQASSNANQGGYGTNTAGG